MAPVHARLRARPFCLVLRCSLSPRLTREFKIHRGKREPGLDGPTPLNSEVYKIDGVVVAYDPERICERLNGPR
jgi:hypothetical protein